MSVSESFFSACCEQRQDVEEEGKAICYKIRIRKREARKSRKDGGIEGNEGQSRQRQRERRDVEAAPEVCSRTRARGRVDMASNPPSMTTKCSDVSNRNRVHAPAKGD